VLIIGGGLVGCATAWHLAKAGARVTLVEAGELNAGASGQNAGSLHFQLERRFIENGGGLTDQVARTLELNAAAVNEWRGLEAELATDLHVTLNGGLMVAERAEEVALLEAKVRWEQAAGLPSRLVDGAQARALCPALSPSIVAADYLTDEGQADPRTVTPTFAAAARAAGAEIRTRTSLVGITRVGAAQFDATLVSGSTHSVERAEQIVIAAGGWSGAIASHLNVRLPLSPVALQMNVTARAPPLLNHLIQHAGKRLSMKQATAGNLLLGGGWPALLAQGDGGFDLSRRPTLIQTSVVGNLRAAVDTVPQVAQLTLIRSWTGITTNGVDELPIVGELPRVRGCYVAVGGSAFTLGPTFARSLARTMAGGREPLLEMVSPTRFEHLNDGAR
jgi:glycine/D-amino acid oxidase-like deaminating enzyme